MEMQTEHRNFVSRKGVWQRFLFTATVEVIAYIFIPAGSRL